MKYKPWSFCAIILLHIYRDGANCATQAEQDNFLLGRSYNPHPLRRTGTSVAEHIIKQLRNSKLGRNGPVLFPNDGSPSPPTPLIVTSRPLAQEIRDRSDRRRPYSTPNSILSNPKYYAQSRSNIYYSQPPPDYPDYNHNSQLVPLQNIGASDHRLTALQQAKEINDSNKKILENHPYAGVAKKIKSLTSNHGRPGFTSLEQQTVVPPLYSALDNYAKTKVLKDRKQETQQSKTTKVYKNKNHATKDGAEDEYYNDNFGNEAKQYAFSYAVRDHQTGDDFSHSQRQSGSATNGEYRVKLPDGRLQIVSYTADNGGYNAEVRYEDDLGDVENQNRKKIESYQNVKQVSSTASPRVSPRPVHDDKLGRIVVPSREYQEYQEEDEFVEYYDDDDEESKVKEAPDEVLITSKPGYTIRPTEPNLLYKQLIYHDEEGNTAGYAVTTTGPVVYVHGENSNQDLVDQKYQHFYHPHSVKFVSTTPKYEVEDNSIATGGPTPSTTLGGYFDGQRGYFTASSTPAPGVADIYDHLDSPDVNLKSKGGQVKYTSVSPLVYRVSQGTTPGPSYLGQSRDVGTNRDADGDGRNYYQTPVKRIDLNKYFTYTKR